METSVNIRFANVLSGCEVTTIQSFAGFEEEFGAFTETSFTKQGLRICLFGDNERVAFLHPYLKDWTDDDIHTDKGGLYIVPVVINKRSLRLVVDCTWENALPIISRTNPILCEHCDSDIDFDLDNRVRQTELALEHNQFIEDNEVVSTTPFEEICEHHALLHIGIDYYPYTHRGEMVYTFKKFINYNTNEILKIFSLSDYTIGQLRRHKELYSVELRKSNYYVFVNTKQRAAGCHHSLEERELFEDLWKNYYRVRDFEDREALDRRTQDFYAKQNRFPFFDMSGDDLSLNPNMW